MGRESREVWEKRVVRWRESGLSAKEFAAELGVNVHTLTHWAWRLGQVDRAAPAEKRRRPAAAAPAAAPVPWLEVVAPDHAATATPSASAPPFELVLVTGRTIRVPTGFEADALKRLIAVAEAR